MQISEALDTSIAQTQDMLDLARNANSDENKIALLAAAIHAGSFGLNVANDIRVGKQDHAALTADEQRKAAIPEHLVEIVQNAQAPATTTPPQPAEQQAPPQPQPSPAGAAATQPATGPRPVPPPPSPTPGKQ